MNTDIGLTSIDVDPHAPASYPWQRGCDMCRRLLGHKEPVLGDAAWMVAVDIHFIRSHRITLAHRHKEVQ